jgi:hypothetical protein
MTNKKSKRFQEQDEETSKEQSLQEKIATLIMPKDDEMRLIGLFGEVEETKVSILVASLIDLADTTTEVPKDPDGRAKLYADHVWSAFASTTTIIAATGGQSPDDDEGGNDGE